ncbi:hypothetical protein [uncultured Campylobacter sp.]|uniref:hypothetical protein n=1 Tax=uncultured Campylobacter sp. TaxID=218934 RepID=UPI00261425A9|nr:hypothetical protein [uncultured Campylobacter sp.]
MRRNRLGYAANASDQAFFTSAVCNTRLRERSVNRVLSVIEAWLNDHLATISLNAYLTPNLAEFRRKIYA